MVVGVHDIPWTYGGGALINMTHQYQSIGDLICTGIMKKCEIKRFHVIMSPMCVCVFVLSWSLWLKDLVLVHCGLQMSLLCC